MLNNLQEYYHVLNENSTSSIHSLILSNNLKRILQNINEETEKDKCLIELKFNEFEIKKGEYIPQSSIGSQHFPSIEDFNDIEYLKERASNCKNNRFKAKYNHLIYFKSKNNQYGQRAVDSYFELIKLNTFDLNNNSEIIIFIETFENLILLSKKIKYKHKEILELTTELINDISIIGYSKYFILYFATNNIQLSKEQNEYFFEIILKHLDDIDYSFEYLKLIEKIALKIGKPAKEYQNLIGEKYVELGLDKNEDFTSHKDLFDALKWFQKSGNKERTKEVSELLQKSKANTGLKDILIPIEDELFDWYYKSLNSHTSKIINENCTQNIFYYIILCEKLLPKSELFEEYHKSEIQELFSTLTFDKNNNLSLEYKGIHQYNLNYQMFSKQHINQIFTKGIINKKINYNDIQKYLEENTWYNCINDEYYGNTPQYNWLELLLPSIKLYFDNVTIIDNQLNVPQDILIVVIDSLTLKFEGILRYFSQKAGAQTIRLNEDGTKESVNLENLINDEKIKEIIPIDDLTFFKFIFTKEGINQRNNIAHCFNSPKDYSIELFWNLLTVLFKLGNYHILKNENGYDIKPRFII